MVQEKEVLLQGAKWAKKTAAGGGSKKRETKRE
jgi:hypothetical protein